MATLISAMDRDMNPGKTKSILFLFDADSSAAQLELAYSLSGQQWASSEPLDFHFIQLPANNAYRLNKNSEPYIIPDLRCKDKDEYILLVKHTLLQYVMLMNSTPVLCIGLSSSCAAVFPMLRHYFGFPLISILSDGEARLKNRKKLCRHSHAIFTDSNRLANACKDAMKDLSWRFLPGMIRKYMPIRQKYATPVVRFDSSDQSIAKKISEDLPSALFSNDPSSKLETYLSELDRTLIKMNDPKKLCILIRYVSERTMELCRNLLQAAFPDIPIKLVSEEPFSKVLRVGFEKALETDAEWTLILDADILPESNAIAQLLHYATEKDEQHFGCQGLIFDKFFGILRPAGNHLYRTRFLPEALKLIPEEGTSLRPESETINRMIAAGYKFYQVPFIIGLHDFEQNFIDIARKCFLQAHKHRRFLEHAKKMWESEKKDDPDFLVALAAIDLGFKHKGKVLVDASFLSQASHHALDGLNVTDKPQLQLSDYDANTVRAQLKKSLLKLDLVQQNNLFPLARWEKEITI